MKHLWLGLACRSKVGGMDPSVGILRGLFH
jgi:hypothetical protein